MIMSDNFTDPSAASHPDSVLRLSALVHRLAIVSLLLYRYFCAYYYPLTHPAYAPQ